MALVWIEATFVGVSLVFEWVEGFTKFELFLEASLAVANFYWFFDLLAGDLVEFTGEGFLLELFEDWIFFFSIFGNPAFYVVF